MKITKNLTDKQKKDIFSALEDAIENMSSESPDLHSDYCARTAGHKGMCVLITKIIDFK